MSIKSCVPHYERAPIAEALIDVQFTGAAGEAHELVELQSLEGGSYPEKRPLFLSSIHYSPQPGQPPAVTSEPSKQLGWAFISADNLKFWQAKLNGFTFSRLAPYESWEPFRDEARRLWDLSKPILRPETITRIAVRYVNRLEIPLPLRDFKDYLRTVPEVSPDLPQGLYSYFMQLQLPYNDIKSALVLNLSLVPPPQPDSKTTTVILDIDLFRAIELPPNDDGLWSFLEQLHTKKNDVFEGCITDLARELFK